MAIKFETQEELLEDRKVGLPSELEEPRKLRIGAEKPSVGVAPDAMEQRLMKAAFALGDKAPSLNYMQIDFEHSLEQETRRQAVIEESMTIRGVKHEIIQELLLDAQARGETFTVEEQEQIIGLSTEEMLNPDTILEKLYARRYVQSAVALEDPEIDEVLADAEQEDPEIANRILDAGEETVTIQELAIRNLQEMKEVYNKTGYLRLGVDFLAGVVPFVSYENLVDRSDSLPEGSRWTGTNIKQTVQGLMRLTPEEYKIESQKMLKEVAEENILDAMHLAQALVGYTYSDEYWDNLTLGLDTYDVGTLGAALGGGLIKAGISPLGRLLGRVRSVVRANATTKMTVEDGLAAAGKLEHAAIEKVAKKLSTREASPVVATKIEELGRQVPGLADPNSLARNAGVKANERARRTVEYIKAKNERLLEIFNAPVIQRYGPQVQDAVIQRATRDFLRDYHKLEDAVIDIRSIRESHTVFGGVDGVEVQLGRMDATSFDSVKSAEKYAREVYKLPKGGYKITEDDGNVVISMVKYGDETSLDILDLRIMTEHPVVNTPIQDFMSALGSKNLSGWASPDDILSDLQVGNRKIATFGTNRVRELLQDAAKDIRLPTKSSRQALQKVLEANHFQKTRIRRTDGTYEVRSGAWHNTVAELDRGWRKANGRLPTQAETNAYFAFKHVMDMDWMMMNLSVLRDKSRLGIEQKSMSFLAEVDGKEMRVSTPFFEGRTVPDLPHFGQEAFNVAWIDKKGRLRNRLSSRMTKAQRDEIQELIDDGQFKIIQTFDGGGPLRKTFKAGAETVDYVVAREIKTKPLDTMQVEYRGGGHRVYPEFGRYISQPNVSFSQLNNRVIRRGDITAHWDPTVAGGKKLGAAYEEARQMILEGRTAAEINKFVKENLPFYKSGREFTALFRGLPGAAEDAPFDIRSPFVVRKSGQSSTDILDLKNVFGKDVVDYSNSEHNLQNKMFTHFVQERSDMLTRVRREGTDDNPVYKLEPAPIMDPMRMVSRASDQLVNSRFFNDYRHAHIENWATRHGRFLDGVTEAQLRANPLKYLLDPVWKKTDEKGALAAAKADRRAIIQLMNMESDGVIDLKNVSQKVADTISARAGKATEELVDSWRWYDPKLRPAQWARSVAFNAYLGFFAVKQFKLQASAVAHIYAITGDPIVSTKAILNYGLIRAAMASHNNKVGVAAKLAKTAFGMDEDQFNELFKLYNNAGVHQFMGETAQLDTVFRQGPFRTGTDKVVAFGQIPFREGNLVSRGASFNAAYLEFRKANPHKKITSRELHTILRRASIMSVDQTRDSINPRLETGLAKFMQQFFTFQNRLSDQMLGTRLTPAERLRVMGVWSLLYGPPAGVVGTAVGRFWPVYDHVREEALSQGWDPNDTDPVTRWMVEGSLPQLVELATGHKLDVTSTYGPGGVDWIRNVFEGDDTLLELAVGASGSFWGDNVLRAAQPFLMYMTDILANPGGDSAFKPMDSDYEHAFRTLSSVDQFFGAYYAINLQQKWSKDGRWLDRDVDPLSGILTSLSGWEAVKVTDAYRKMTAAKHRRRAMEAVTQLALKEVRLGFYEMVQNRDKEAMDQHMRRAEVYMEGAELDSKEQVNVIKRALRENETLVDKINRDFIGAMPERYRRLLLENEKRRLQGDE